MKRLLCIISSLDAGGAETFLMKIYRALPPDRYQMDFVVSADNGYYTQEILERGGRIFFVPMRTKHPIKAFWELKRIVKNNGYRHVLKLSDSPIAVVDLLAAKCGGAKVLAVRSCNALTNLSWKKKLLDGLLRPILNQMATVKIAPSDLAAAYTFGQKQLDRGKVILLNNAVDLEVFRFDPEGREAIRRELSLENKTVIGHVGRFNVQKNHRFLLEVFCQIRKKEESAVLLLVGKGELEMQIREHARQLKISDSVLFTGVRSDVPQLLSAMDVLLLPSLHEGMPNVVIEAQATGLPCVIADTITRSADVTGLVQYLPLGDTVEDWAQAALAAVGPRQDTKEKMKASGYDIHSVVHGFAERVFYK